MANCSTKWSEPSVLRRKMLDFVAIIKLWSLWRRRWDRGSPRTSHWAMRKILSCSALILATLISQS